MHNLKLKFKLKAVSLSMMSMLLSGCPGDTSTLRPKSKSRLKRLLHIPGKPKKESKVSKDPVVVTGPLKENDNIAAAVANPKDDPTTAEGAGDDTLVAVVVTNTSNTDEAKTSEDEVKVEVKDEKLETIENEQLAGELYKVHQELIKRFEASMKTSMQTIIDTQFNSDEDKKKAEKAQEKRQMLSQAISSSCKLGGLSISSHTNQLKKNFKPYNTKSIEDFQVALKGAEQKKEIYNKYLDSILELEKITDKDRLTEIKEIFREIEFREIEIGFFTQRIKEKKERPGIPESPRQSLNSEEKNFQIAQQNLIKQRNEAKIQKYTKQVEASSDSLKVNLSQELEGKKKQWAVKYENKKNKSARKRFIE